MCKSEANLILKVVFVWFCINSVFYPISVYPISGLWFIHGVIFDFKFFRVNEISPLKKNKKNIRGVFKYLIGKLNS
jgi:hypothetical protein